MQSPKQLTSVPAAYLYANVYQVNTNTFSLSGQLRDYDTLISILNIITIIPQENLPSCSA